MKWARLTLSLPYQSSIYQFMNLLLWTNFILKCDHLTSVSRLPMTELSLKHDVFCCIFLWCSSRWYCLCSSKLTHCHWARHMVVPLQVAQREIISTDRPYGSRTSRNKTRQNQNVYISHWYDVACETVANVGVCECFWRSRQLKYLTSGGGRHINCIYLQNKLEWIDFGCEAVFGYIDRAITTADFITAYGQCRWIISYFSEMSFLLEKFFRDAF